MPYTGWAKNRYTVIYVLYIVYLLLAHIVHLWNDYVEIYPKSISKSKEKSRTVEMPSGFGNDQTITECARQGATCGSTSRHFGKQTAQGFLK